MSFGKLLAAFGCPNGDPRRPKMTQKTSKSGFVDISKTLVFIRENMVFGGLGGIRRHVEGIQEAFEGFWGAFGGFWRDLGGPGGFWEAWEHGFDWISKILWVRGHGRGFRGQEVCHQSGNLWCPFGCP